MMTSGTESAENGEEENPLDGCSVIGWRKKYRRANEPIGEDANGSCGFRTTRNEKLFRRQMAWAVEMHFRSLSESEFMGPSIDVFIARAVWVDDGATQLWLVRYLCKCEI